MYAQNELMFPHHAIPSLRLLRGPQWQALVEHVMCLPETHEETLALMMMMIRLNGCVACETDSYRAMRGCAACALQTLRRYKGNDAELTRLFEESLGDVRQFANLNPSYGITDGSMNYTMRPPAEFLPLTLDRR